jgi:hypothetical protein
MTTPERELEFRTPAGQPERHPAVLGRDREIRGREPCIARRVRLGGGRRLWQVRLPQSARGDERAREALEHEAGAAVALHRAFASGPRGLPFTPVVGCDLDAPEPFLLYAPRKGQPLAVCGERLNGERLRELMKQLVEAACLLERVGYVYRAISPDSVWWDEDEQRAWLSEPFGAVPAGHPRTAFGQPPWAAPEQLSGTGDSDPRDDVWSVARVTYAMFAGRPGPAAGPPADLDAYPGLTALRDEGAFSPYAADRPGPHRVLELLVTGDPPKDAPPDDLAAGRLEFDGQLAAKRRAFGLDPPDDDESGGGDPPGGGRPWWRGGGGGRRRR